MSDVRAIGGWSTNGQLIADVAQLGYLDGTVLDATYGEGGFWTKFVPDRLATNDIDPSTPTPYHHDYKELPFDDGSFDAVVFDPPYRLNGTPDQGAFDERYGIAVPTRWQDKISDIVAGAVECYRVTLTFLLVKCQAQVVSGAVRWQDDIITRAIEAVGGRKVDRFDLVTPLRPQPPGRKQVHARRNHSTLLVFKKGKL